MGSMVMGSMVMGSMVMVMVMGSPHPQGSPDSESSSSQSSSSSGSSAQSSPWSSSEPRSLSSSESSPDSAPPSPPRNTPKYSYSGPTPIGFYIDEWYGEETDGGKLKLRPLKDLEGNIADPLYMGAWHRPLPAVDPDVVQVEHVPTANDGVYPPRGVFTVQVPRNLRHISLENGDGAAWCFQWQGPELGYKIIPGYYIPRFLQGDYESLRMVNGRCLHMGTPPICLQSAPWWVPDERIHWDPFIFNIVDPYTSASQPTNLSGLVTDTEPVTFPVILPNTLRGALYDRWPLAKPVTRGWYRMYRWTSRQKRARLEW